MKMKFFVLAVAGTLISSLLQAQIKKGSLLIGGSAGYGSYKEEVRNTMFSSSLTEIKFRNFSVSPSMGIAIKDNFIIGADLIYEVENENHSSKPTGNNGNVGVPVIPRQKYKNFAKGGGFFARQYWEVARNFYVFGQGRLGFAITRQEHDQSINPSLNHLKGWNIAASLYPGLSYAISKKVHLESTFFNLFTLQYQSLRNNTDPEIGTSSPGETTRFSASSSFDNASAFSLGVRVLLSK